MSTSEVALARSAVEPPHTVTPTGPLVDTKFAKQLVTACAAMPLLVLAWDAIHGALGVNGVNYAIHSTGMVGLVLLMLSLVITPLRRFVKADRIGRPLIAVRRNLGVAGFCYLALHFFIFFWFDRARSVSSTLEEILDREYLWFGVASLLILIPLTITSTDAMITRLGKRWKLLHRLSYVAVLCGVIHFYLQVKADVLRPQIFLAIFLGLMAFRVGSHYVDLRGEITTLHAKLRAAKTSAKAGAKQKFWSGELTVARIFQETPDVKTFRFVSLAGGAIPFQHVAGQYLNVQLPIGGKRVNRSYTIASSPTHSDFVEISVKRAADGYASHYLHDHVKAGDVLKISAPAGKFGFAGHESERVVLVAGGVGMTPMMSVIRSLTDRGWTGQIYLLFVVRKPSDVIFEQELGYLRARFPNLHVTITVSDPVADPTWTGPRGRITEALVSRVVPNLTRGPVLVCGPAPMMVATRELLVRMGVPDAEVLEEAFVSPAPPSAPPPSEGDGDPVAESLIASAEAMAATVTFAKSNATGDLPPESTVLEAAEEAGVAIPFECRSGICGQCKCQLLSGRVTMAAQDALTPADKKRGLILACQARALTPELTIDA